MVFPPENILKIVVSDILKECSKLNTILEGSYVEYYIKLIALNPDYGKLFSKIVSIDYGEFIRHCIGVLTDEKSLTNLMITMQYNFEKEYDTLDNLVMKNQDNIDQRTEPLMKEIIEAKPGTKEEFEKLLRRISIYIVLKSGLGNPGNIQVLREGTAALNSIFTMDDLKSFNEQKNQFKERQLNELLGIVSGIRIFNKDCGKGGEIIPELTNNLSEAAEATSLALSHCLIRIMERVNLLTTTVDSHILIDPDTKQLTIALPINKNVKNDDYNHLCKILSVYRQYEILVRKLISDMECIQGENKEICVNFSSHLYDLHSLVRYRTAIPADQVFPYFMQLWNFWRKMQNNMYLISVINNMMWNLDAIHEKTNIPHPVIDNLLNKRRIISDAERMTNTADCKIDHAFSKCQLVFLTDKFVDDLIYQYLGFCGVCICVGALIPANPNMGLLKWGERYYAFCTPEHGKYFGVNPNKYIKETWAYVRNNVEMINFLQIYDDIFTIRHMTNLGTKHIDAVKTEEKETQTELHPISSNIDRNYIWNIWDYKKKVCQMANLIKCRTHSTQTHESPSKFEIGCQTAYHGNLKIINLNNEKSSAPEK